MKAKSSPDDGKNVIYRTVITLRNGRRITAAQCGLKAFRIPIDPSKPYVPKKTKPEKPR